MPRSTITGPARFRDTPSTVYDFADDVLVRCPRCSGCAEILPAPGHSGPEHLSGWSCPRRLHCRACGYVRQTDARRTCWGNSDRAQARDPYFGLPLWLQTESCSGRTLWAYSIEHLLYLQTFVAARVRERAHPPEPGGYHRRMTMIARLPAWLTRAKNRREVLKKINRLVDTVPEPIHRRTHSPQAPARH